MTLKMAKKITSNNSSALLSSKIYPSTNTRIAENKTNTNNAKSLKRVAMRDEALSTRKKLSNKINKAINGKISNPHGGICWK
tara:strand:+ start:15384 stop:15629 length:246 start_codon:yes stop_codon:yes gene_type:complete